jgi:lipoprotein-anchoring transpeptidase ErfK/SrfK
VRDLLAGGTNPNDAMPVPLDPAVAGLFRPTVLNYFMSGERGLTPLMVAATMGHAEIAEILLQAGANPNAQTKRHGTNALWLAGYKGHTDVTKLLLGVTPGSEADRMRIEVDLSEQTARLYVDNVAEEAVPISSGRKGYPTPKGEFVVTNKHRQWRSTIYGSSMPFYLRLSCRAFGLHAGHLPGYPASHGCIRLNKKDAQRFFDRVPVGTVVVIK